MKKVRRSQKKVGPLVKELVAAVHTALANGDTLYQLPVPSADDPTQANHFCLWPKGGNIVVELEPELMPGASREVVAFQRAVISALRQHEMFLPAAAVTFDKETNVMTVTLNEGEADRMALKPLKEPVPVS